MPAFKQLRPDNTPAYQHFDVLAISDFDKRVAKVTAISFSADSGLMAVACVYEPPSLPENEPVRHDIPPDRAEGLIRIYSLGRAARLVDSFRLPAHPTVLVWCQSVLIVGDRSGAVTMVNDIGINAQPYHDTEHWDGGEIRAITINNNSVALGTFSLVHIAKVRPVGGYKPSVWYDRRRALFPSSASSVSTNQTRSPVSLAIIEHRDTLVVTYQYDGIVLYNIETGLSICHIPSTSDMIRSSALSPQGTLLAAVNVTGGVDSYLLEAEHSRYDRTMVMSPPVAAFVPVTVTFVYEGQDMLVGGTRGAARIVSSDGWLRQNFLLKDGGNLFYQGVVQEAAYLSYRGNHYVAFGTADDEGKNVVTIYRASPGVGQKIKKNIVAAASVGAALFLITAVCVGTYFLWCWSFSYWTQMHSLFTQYGPAEDFGQAGYGYGYLENGQGLEDAFDGAGWFDFT